MPCDSPFCRCGGRRPKVAPMREEHGEPVWAITALPEKPDFRQPIAAIGAPA